MEARKQKAARPRRARSLYVHVPFCVRKCRYCDFYSCPTSDASRVGAWRDALLHELDLRQGDLLPGLETIFVGGGTPTAIGAAHMGQLLARLAPLARAGAEVSVEANPGALDAACGDALAGGGVNRVNLGVQSFDADELALLGRIHSPAQAGEALAVLRGRGIDNVGLDLIYGIPGQDLQSWRDSLERALDLGPEHLSTYALSFEPGTELMADLQAGRLREADEQLQRDCYYLAIDRIEAAGLEHYEISNFARPGRRCRHNLVYWHNLPYLGLGPGAASYVEDERRTNQPDLEAYCSALSQGRLPPGEAERLDRRGRMAETLMLTLRLREGVDRAAFAEAFGEDPADAFPASIPRHLELGALEAQCGRLRISAEYLFVADAVLADIVAES